MPREPPERGEAVAFPCPRLASPQRPSPRLDREQPRLPEAGQVVPGRWWPPGDPRGSAETLSQGRGSEDAAAAGPLPLPLTAPLPPTARPWRGPPSLPLTPLFLFAHRLPEEHLLRHARAALLSSGAQQLQPAPPPGTEGLGPVALQPADPVHLRALAVEPRAAGPVHQRAAGVPLPAPVHQPEGGKHTVGRGPRRVRSRGPVLFSLCFLIFEDAGVNYHYIFPGDQIHNYKTKTPFKL